MNRSTTGVTLLEILLVLTISAAILVASVRYYESATVSLDANSALEQVQVITATVDHFVAGTYSYEGINTNVLASLLPNNSLLTPWGTSISIDSSDSFSYSVTFPKAPAKVCPLITSKLETNKRYHVTSLCHQMAADFKYTYTANA